MRPISRTTDALQRGLELETTWLTLPLLRHQEAGTPGFRLAVACWVAGDPAGSYRYREEESDCLPWCSPIEVFALTTQLTAELQPVRPTRLNPKATEQ